MHGFEQSACFCRFVGLFSQQALRDYPIVIGRYERNVEGDVGHSVRRDNMVWPLVQDSVPVILVEHCHDEVQMDTKFLLVKAKTVFESGLHLQCPVSATRTIVGRDFSWLIGQLQLEKGRSICVSLLSH
jgi:hypothetical protein